VIKKFNGGQQERLSALIVPFACHLQAGLDDKAEQQNITSTALTLLSFGLG